MKAFEKWWDETGDEGFGYLHAGYGWHAALEWALSILDGVYDVPEEGLYAGDVIHRELNKELNNESV